MRITSYAAGALAAAAVLTGGAAAADAASGPVSTGHSAWAWGNPTPQGQDLSAVAFDGQTGYAVGDFGTVLRSDDAGATWTGLPSGTVDDLSVVQELSPTTVVAGGGCSVEESTDSGQTFQQLPLGLSSSCTDNVAAVAFATAQQGYVATQGGTLLYTDNAGATVEARSSVPVGSGQLTGLAFSSPTTGLAVTSGGTIERTTDGGNSWNQVQVASTGLRGVAIVNPTLAFAVGDGGELLRSTDGGSTWTRLPLTLTGGGAAPNLHTITCADPNDCLISTTNANELVRTTDGGQTGTIVSVSNHALDGVAYTAGTRVVGVGGGGTTVISDDAGQTFPTVTSGGLSYFNAVEGALVAGRAPGSAYLPGDGGGIVATTDSGRSWSLLRVPTSQSIQSVAFASKSTGYALDDRGVLHRTTDGGTSWSSFAEGHSPRSVLVAPTKRALLLVGPRGIFRATNGGSDFHKVQGRVRAGRRRGAKVSSLRLDSALAVRGGVVAFHNADAATHVVVSTDAGRTWRSVPLPPHKTNDVTVAAVSPRRLWFRVGDVLYATSDGGRHWHPLPAIGRLGGFDFVSFSSPRDGIVVVRGKAPDQIADPLDQVSTLRTTNGGRTWVPDVIVQNSLLLDDVLATSTGDLAVSDAATGSGPSWYFTTAGTPKPAHHTTLSVRFARRKITARALARAGHSVLVTGRVRPVLSPDEKVAVSVRANKGVWRLTKARVASNGAFRLHIGHVRTRAQVVAQEIGTSAIAGAGTPVKTLTVKR